MKEQMTCGGSKQNLLESYKKDCDTEEESCTTHVTFRMPKNKFNELESISKKLGVSRSKLIRQGVEEVLE